MVQQQTARRLSLPGLLLRVEGAAVLLAAVFVYFRLGLPWWAFLVFLLAPDLSAIGYLAGPRVGSVTYNLAHIIVWPLALWVLGWALGWAWAAPVALIWLAHIGMDRMVGYGLKYPDDFKHTHLDRL
jgi:hypothetical protein